MKALEPTYDNWKSNDEFRESEPRPRTPAHLQTEAGCKAADERRAETIRRLREKARMDRELRGG